MNEYAIIFWLSFITLFLGHFLFLGLESKKINIFNYLIILFSSCAVYITIDYLAVNYGPNYTNHYISQSLIGMSAGWFISKNLKNVFRLTNHRFITSILLILGWHNYVF